MKIIQKIIVALTLVVGCGADTPACASERITINYKYTLPQAPILTAQQKQAMFYLLGFAYAGSITYKYAGQVHELFKRFKERAPKVLMYAGIIFTGCALYKDQQGDVGVFLTDTVNVVRHAALGLWKNRDMLAVAAAGAPLAYSLISP